MRGLTLLGRCREATILTDMSTLFFLSLLDAAQLVVQPTRLCAVVRNYNKRMKS